ncbi:HepT-like ribonuclease domain-containing protein [Bradyrhizobium sp. B097]|uniref:HepT-like ribonuclease domain-containing protein n=1 Tax=Bradyrhizobium sp. B097 TaxID=3140244 RepID=UPI003183AE37
MQPTVADRIATAIDSIRDITAEQTRESFANNLVMRLAVERLLEMISEASRHIPTDLKAREPGINWRRLADLGNWLRHAYHRTDADLLWIMVEDDLSRLKAFVDQITRELKH